MHVALFGGSFNPPHVAHQLVALYVLETQAVDALWLLPCFKHPFEKELAPFSDRLEMCRRAAEGLGPRVKVSDVESRLGGESYTLRTVKTLIAENPGVRFSLVVGSDLEGELATWFGAEELQRLVSTIVVGRANDRQPVAPGGVAMPAVSSTEIRARLRRGESVAGLVPRAVLAYLQSSGLFLG